MVRTDSHQLHPAAGTVRSRSRDVCSGFTGKAAYPAAISAATRQPGGRGIKVLARTQKTPIWERTRGVQRLRHQLREYFPAALEVFEDLDAAPDVLELLGKAPDRQRVRVWVERFADQVVDRAVLLGRVDVVMRER